MPRVDTSNEGAPNRCPLSFFGPKIGNDFTAGLSDNYLMLPFSLQYSFNPDDDSDTIIFMVFDTEEDVIDISYFTDRGGADISQGPIAVIDLNQLLINNRNPTASPCSAVPSEHWRRFLGMAWYGYLEEKMTPKPTLNQVITETIAAEEAKRVLGDVGIGRAIMEAQRKILDDDWIACGGQAGERPQAEIDISVGGEHPRKFRL